MSWDGLQDVIVVFPGHIHLSLDQARHSFIVRILCFVLVLLCALSSFATILVGKRELVALL